MKSRDSYKSPFDMNVGEMTPEEVIERLRAMGIEPNSWVDNEDTVDEENPKQAPIPTLTHYAKMLKELGGIIEDQVRRDLKETDDLSYQLRRLKRGGG